MRKTGRAAACLSLLLAASAAAAADRTARPAGAQNASQVEMLFWQSVMNSRSTGDYQAYLEKYPDGQFAPLARARITSLSKPAAPAAAPPPEPPPAPPTLADLDGDWVATTPSCVAANHAWPFLRLHWITPYSKMEGGGSHSADGLDGAKMQTVDDYKRVSDTAVQRSNWAATNTLKLLDKDDYVEINTGFEETCRFARLGSKAASMPDDPGRGYGYTGADKAFGNALLSALSGVAGGQQQTLIRNAQTVMNSQADAARRATASSAQVPGHVASMNDYPPGPDYGYVEDKGCRILDICGK